MQAINLLQGLIPGEDAPRQADAAFLEKLFVFSLMWSIGASLELGDRKKVSSQPAKRPGYGSRKEGVGFYHLLDSVN